MEVLASKGAPVEKAMAGIEGAVKRTGKTLENLGSSAGKGVSSIGDGAPQAASKIEGASKTAADSLKNISAQAEAVKAKTTQALDSVGMSAKQTAAAMRQVPAQFQDIVVSLQGGMNPLTVFMQQGSQLATVFGGAGAAAKALGGYVVGLVSPFTVAAAAGVALGAAYYQGSKEADAYRNALIQTGNAAGTTAAQMKAYAQEISIVVGTQGKAAEALAAFASTGKVTSDILRVASQAAVSWERSTSQAVDKTAEQFAALRNDPLAAVMKLNDGMNFLTDSTYKQIKSLEEQGRTAEAANVAQRAFAETLSWRAGEMERNLGSVERGWLAVKDAAKGAWDAILNVGRASTSVDQLAEVRRQIALRENQIANAGFATNEGGAAFGRPSQANTERLRAELAGLQAQAAALEGVAYASRTAAEEERKRAEQVKASAAFDKAGEKFLSDKAKMERELAAARVQGADAGKSQAAIEERLREIRESYAKKGGGGDVNRELERQAKLLAELSGLSGSFAQDWQSLNNAFAAGKLNVEQLTQEQAKLLAKQPFAVAQAKELADATKSQAKISEEAARAHLKFVESFGKGASSAQQQIDHLKTEEAAATIAANGYYSLAQAIELVHIARLEEQQQGLLGNEEAYLAVQKEIDARKELIGLIGSKEARKSAEDSAKDAARDWQRAADDINRSLTDALLRGFESGKGFAKNFVDTMKNLFSTLVLRPVISAIVSPVAGAITGALGLAGTASAGTSAVGAIGSGASLLGSAGSLLGGAGTAAGYGFSALMSGNGLGALSGGLGMLTSGGPAAIMAQGAGMIAGVLGPIALGIGALTAIIGKTKGETRTGGQFGVSFDGTVTNQRRGETYTYQGQQFDRDFSNGQRNALIAGQAYRLEGDPVQNEQAIRDAVSGTASGINAFLKALGSKATLTGFSAGLETSGKGRGGVFAGGILSDGTTFGESGKGDNYAGTLYEKFSTNSPDFKTALENFTLDLKQSTIQALQSVTDIPETVKKMLKGVDAEALSEEAANALLESINAQIVGVQNLTSAFEAMGLDELAAMGFDAAAGLAAAAGGFDKLQTNLNTYYDNFYTDEEKRANLQKQVDKQFAELGIDVPKNRDEFRRLVEGTLEQVDVQDKARASLSKQINDAIAGAGKDGFTLADAGARSIVSGINPALLGNAQADPALAGKLNGFLAGVSDLASKGLDPAAFDKGLAGLIDVNAEVLGIGKDASKTAATLLALSGTFAQLNESADDAAARIAKEQADARDKALRGLERAIDAEKKALQSQIDVAQDVASTMSGLFDLLKSNVQELYGEVDSTRAMLAVQGNDFITQALATARTTGYLPDQTQLADAISAARSGMDSSGYTSQFELDRDRLVLAGKLSELEGLTGKQLTSAERTVKELEGQSEQLGQTLEYWKQQIEIANGTYEATLSVTEAIKTLEKLMFPDKVEIGTLKPQQITGGSSGGAGFGPGMGGGATTKTTIDATTGKRTFSDGSVDYLTEGELDLYRRGILGKVTYFDVGTNYVPKDMLAVVHKGEQIVPAAYNPMLNPGMGGGNGQMEALLAALLEQSARLEVRLAAIEGYAQGTNRATNGNPISPVPVALVEDETV